VSNRRATRKTQKPAVPPEGVRQMAIASECPDCQSEVTARCDPDGMWRVSVAHDDECPQLAWRERNGLRSQMALASLDGGPLDPQALSAFLGAAAQIPGLRGLLVTAAGPDAEPGSAAPGWRIREAVDHVQEEHSDD
jgi:hypothetical protein